MLMWIFFLGIHTAQSADHDSLNRTLRIDASHGRIKRLEKLIRQGVNLNAQSEYGESALYYSVIFGHVKTTRWLLAHGANPNIENDVGRTPLLKAAQDCNDHATEALLRAGAQVNHADQWGKTALMNAVESNCIRTVAILLTRARGKINLRAQDNGLMRAEDFVIGPTIRKMLELAQDGHNELVSQQLY